LKHRIGVVELTAYTFRKIVLVFHVFTLKVENSFASFIL
jgi:hypothetical protein